MSLRSEVRCGEEEGTTAVVYNCLTPRWNETFVFSAHATAREAHLGKLVVHLTVKDRNKHLSDDSLGEVRHPPPAYVHCLRPARAGLGTPPIPSVARVSAPAEGERGDTEVLPWSDKQQ